MTTSDSASPPLLESFPEAAEAGKRLRDGNLTVAVAESCTGGLLGAALTAVPGSSAYVVGGVIAYSDAVKRDLLGVDAALLAEHGAVSEAVARAMAEGARRRLGSDIGLGVTGVAGPDGGSADKPVGLVYIAAADPDRTEVARNDTDLGREENRASAVRVALALCSQAAARLRT
jgi:nicotinamide-nucleotide amidase